VSYATKIGHAHLKVQDLDRSVAFYTRFLNFHETERVGDAYAFLTGGAHHHELALKRVGPNAPRPPEHGTGLFHVAFEVPDRRSFAEAYRALTEAGIEVATVDHYISWAMYFDDPDRNGLEIYWDTRAEPNGRQVWRGDNAPLDRGTILAVLEA
jgi:catechol 2,3-dioxygenase